jgi:hypothetical protein
MMSKIWQSRHLSTKTKVRIFNTTVVSILLNGAETWKATKGIVQKLQAFVNKCLRKVLGIWWPNLMSNEEVWRRTNHEPINIIFKRRKWKWIGHTLRKPQDDITKQALEWNPAGKRRRVRPRQTWQQSIADGLQKARKAWPKIKVEAKKRVHWRHVVEALCSIGNEVNLTM